MAVALFRPVSAVANEPLVGPPVGIAVINCAAMEAWSWPPRMKLSMGRAGWMGWWNRSRRAFTGFSRAGGSGPIWRACLLRGAQEGLTIYRECRESHARWCAGLSRPHALGYRSDAR